MRSEPGTRWSQRQVITPSAVGVALALALVIALGACERAQPSPSTPSPTGVTTTPPPPGSTDPVELPPIIDMGERVLGPYTVRVSRTRGSIYPGVIIPSTVVITPSAEAPAIESVQAWAGYEDPESSRSMVVDMTASQTEAGGWTADVPFPAPYPDEAELWVRIKAVDGSEHVGWFNFGV